MPKPSSKREYRFAGVSVKNEDDGSKTPRLHVSRKVTKLAVWLELPFSMNVTSISNFTLVQLPQLMSKFEAVSHLATLPDFQSPIVCEYLTRLITKYRPDNHNTEKQKKTEGATGGKQNDKKKSQRIAERDEAKAHANELSETKKSHEASWEDQEDRPTKKTNNHTSKTKNSNLGSATVTHEKRHKDD